MSLTYPAFKRSERSLIKQGLNQDEIEYDGWHLPGQREKRDFCGDWSFLGCLNHEKHLNGQIFLKPFQKSCFRADCEKCCFKWLGREASKSFKRMKKYEKQSKKIAKHIIISVPLWDSYKPKKEISKKVYKILKEVKGDSGLVIFHPFRLAKHDIIERGIKKNDWFYSPHYHVIGFGWVDGVVEAFSKYGYVIKNLGKRKSLFGTIYYQLSHCGIKKHNHALTYFGECSYSKLKLDKDESEIEKCPYCKEKLVGVMPKWVNNLSCELKPDPIIMTTEYMANFYEWVLQDTYR